MALSPTSPPRGPSRLIDTSLEMGALADSVKSLGHSALRWLTADESIRFFFVLFFTVHDRFLMALVMPAKVRPCFNAAFWSLAFKRTHGRMWFVCCGWPRFRVLWGSLSLFYTTSDLNMLKSSPLRCIYGDFTVKVAICSIKSLFFWLDLIVLLFL